jgi:hypothetical protein
MMLNFDMSLQFVYFVIALKRLKFCPASKKPSSVRNEAAA